MRRPARPRSPRVRPVTAALAVAVVTGLGLVACAPGAADASGSTAEPTGGATLRGDLTVLAAASLTEAFTALGERFEAAHPGVHVTFVFAGSSALAAQVADGAPADVLATADPATMDGVVAAGHAHAPVVFATNTLRIAVPRGNPGAVTGLDDLADPAVKVALCQPEVPCGTAAAAVLTRAGLEVTPVTLEPDVKAVLAKVRLGEVDAGLVYVTDVVAAGDDVEGVDLPPGSDVTTDYPVATLTAAPHPDAAAAFVDLVLSPTGTEVLSAAGFGRP